MTNKLDDVSNDAVDDYLYRANLTAHENMIGLCLHVCSPDDLATFLEAQAKYLREDII